ncbi:DinB family protein [Actinocorallia sp. B10E7]|uniref:DinB family protein n=1 Tax=Actinocorallia sp. B10E7 TaxID=3153558 RepID=UPI00325E35AB
MTITPDAKDWTWVLERECPECRYDASAVAREDVSGLLLESAARWHSLLRSPGDHAARPHSGRWSPLEYAAHVRDSSRTCLYRLRLMLEQDDPVFLDWDQDAAAVTGRYGEQDPAVVADELLAALQELAAAFASVEGEQWRRKGRRSDGASFTVDTFSRYFGHEPVHHLWDVQA